MASALDVSLDDLIKKNKEGGRGGGRGGRGRGRGGGDGGSGYGGGRSGPVRRAPNRARPSPYGRQPAQQVVEDVWTHDMYDDGAAAAVVPAVAIQTGARLYVSNLDDGVSNEDIKELFGEIGDLKKCSINFDRAGRSKGTAEVVFARKADALQAVKRYNGVSLDGKAMKIEFMGTNLPSAAAGAARRAPVAAAARLVAITPGFQRAAGAVVGDVRPLRAANGAGRGGFGGGGRGGRGGGGRGGRGRGGRGRGRVPDTRDPAEIAAEKEKWAKELDADLDSYHSNPAAEPADMAE